MLGDFLYIIKYYFQELVKHNSGKRNRKGAKWAGIILLVAAWIVLGARLAYKSAGITDKTTAAGSQLDDLSLVEHLIAHTLRTGMAAGRNYKDIYQDCKNRLEAMRYLQCTA